VQILRLQHCSVIVVILSDLMFFKLADNIFHFLDVLVAPATLVVPQGPVGGHGRTTYDLLVLSDDIIGLRPSKQVKIQDSWKIQQTQTQSYLMEYAPNKRCHVLTSNDVVFDGSFVHLYVHAIAAPQEHSMSRAIHFFHVILGGSL